MRGRYHYHQPVVRNKSRLKSFIYRGCLNKADIRMTLKNQALNVLGIRHAKADVQIWSLQPERGQPTRHELLRYGHA